MRLAKRPAVPAAHPTADLRERRLRCGGIGVISKRLPSAPFV
jgi:hypothetical protein